MNRRIFFIYNLSFIYGILITYLIFEKSELIIGILLLCFSIYIINNVKDFSLEIKKYLIGFVIFGIIIFQISYIFSCVDNVENKYVKGKICKINQKDNKSEILIKPDNLHGKILVNYYGKSFIKDEAEGNIIAFTSDLKKPSGSRNPGAFNYKLYLKSKKVYYLSNLRRKPKIYQVNNPITKFEQNLIKKRNKFKAGLDIIEDKNAKAILIGAILGEKESLAEEEYNYFKLNGTAHILAVSGLHVGFIYLLIKKILKNSKGKIATIFSVLLMIIYGNITGYGTATVRALLMFFYGISTRYLKKPFDMLTAASTASFIQLVFNPYLLFNNGFQMSYLAILGIIFFANPMSYLFGKVISFPISIQLGLTPYILYSYNYFNPLTILINIPIIFLASIFIPIGILVFAIEIMLGIYPRTFIELIGIMAGIESYMNKFLYFNGEFVFNRLMVNLGIIIFIYGTTLLLFSEYSRVEIIRKNYLHLLKTGIQIFILVILLSVGFKNDFLNTQAVFIDVGQGDAIHIRVDEGVFKKKKNYIIDGGGKIDYNIGEKILKDYFLKNGVNEVDAAFITHLHTDHYKGVCELSKEKMVKNIYVYEAYKLNEDKISKETNLSGKHIKYLAKGDIVKLGKGASIEILWPNRESDNKYEDIIKDETDENKLSLVFKININDQSILVTGDIDSELMKELAYTEQSNLKSTIIKVPHHGSKYSIDDEFINYVNPQIAIIQVGKNNYGHPSKEAIEFYKKHNIKVLRNDIYGAIGIKFTDDNRINIKKMIEY